MVPHLPKHDEMDTFDDATEFFLKKCKCYTNNETVTLLQN